MTVLVPGNNSYFIGARAFLLNDTVDVAAGHWSNKHITANKAIKWVLGKYVEADNANFNGQYWRLEDLQMKKPTILHSPMNVNHQAHKVVGTFTAAEMMYPVAPSSAEHHMNEDEEDAQLNPYIETLGAFWKFYFPSELKDVEAAFNEGKLFQSMECVASSITCIGENGCGQTFDYAGPVSESYCEHVNSGGVKQLNDPHFTAGALIIPPVTPGWGKAEVKELSQLIAEQSQVAEKAYNAISEEAPHLDAATWEDMMLQFMKKTVKV